MGGKFRYFFSSGFPNAVNCSEAILGDQGFKRFGKSFQRAGSLRVGADFERIFSFELQQASDVFEDVGYFIFVH